MKEKILVLTDNSKARGLRLLVEKAKLDNLEFHILTLGVTPEELKRRNPDKGEVFKNCKFIEVKEVSENIQTKVGEFYIDFIFRLQQRVLPGLFFYKGKNLFWFLELTEKCPVHNKIVNRLFYLGLAREVIDNYNFDKIYLDIDDFLVAKALSEWRPADIRHISFNFSGRLKEYYFGSFVYFILRILRNSYGLFFIFLGRSIALKIAGIKGVLPKSKKAIFFYTNYPFWWNNPYSDEATEKFFGSTPEQLAQVYPVYYAAWLFSLNPLRVFIKNKQLKCFFEKKNMVLLEPLLKIREKAKIISFGLFSWVISVRKYFKESIRVNYQEFDITKMVYYEINRSLTHIELFNDMLIENAFRNFNNLYQPEALIYRIEFQSFEKAILSGLTGETRAVSFQHSTFSKNRISHFFAPEEISAYLKNNNRLAMPLPEIILTSGRYFKDAMVKAGFPEQKIEVCGPLRYRGLVDYLAKNKSRQDTRRRLDFSDSEKIFLVALGWLDEEVKALLTSLVEAALAIEEKVHFIFRSHPHKKYDKKISKFLSGIKPNFSYSFLNEQFPLYDAILISDAVIQILNTLGFESMAIGRVPIAFKNLHTFNFNSTEEVENYIPVVCNSLQLQNTMKLFIENGPEARQLSEKWKLVLGNYFYDLASDPKERFVELLRKHLVVHA